MRARRSGVSGRSDPDHDAISSLSSRAEWPLVRRRYSRDAEAWKPPNRRLNLNNRPQGGEGRHRSRSRHGNETSTVQARQHAGMDIEAAAVERQLAGGDARRDPGEGAQIGQRQADDFGFVMTEEIGARSRFGNRRQGRFGDRHPGFDEVARFLGGPLDHRLDAATARMPEDHDAPYFQHAHAE